jgi:hypothetical protein
VRSLLTAPSATKLRSYRSPQALKYYAAVPNIDVQIIARTLNNRGAALSDKGRYKDADESLLKANAIWRSTLGDSHLKVGQSYSELAREPRGNLRGSAPPKPRPRFLPRSSVTVTPTEGLAIIAKTSETDSALYKADADMCAGL